MNLMDCGDIRRICIAQSTQTAYISDKRMNRIVELQLADSSVRFHDLCYDLAQPWALVFDEVKSHLYVGNSLKKVCVYSMVGPTPFLVKTISDKNIENVSSLAIDSKHDMLYISDCDNHNIVTLENFKFTAKKSVKSPSFMKVHETHLYVTSSIKTESEPIVRTTQKTIDSDVLVSKTTNSCIFIYDRFKWTLQRTIYFNGWLDPHGLQIKNDLIFTLANACNSSTKTKCGRHEFLFIIQTNGILKQRLKLDHTRVMDFAISQDKLIYIQGERNRKRCRVCFIDIV